MSGKKAFRPRLVGLALDYVIHGYTWLFGICMAIALGAIFLTSLFNVPMGDDYLALHTFVSLHQLPSTTLHALTHTGRYTQSITSALAYGLLQNWAPELLSLLVILLSFFVIRKYTSTLLSQCGISQGKLATNLVSGIALIAIITICQPLIPKSTFYMYQAFYFSSAIVTYTLAWLATLLLLHWFIFKTHENRTHSLILTGLLLYIVFLSNETLPASMLLFSIFSFCLSFVSNLRQSTGKQRDLLITLITSGLVALLTMYFSSGNTIRRRELNVQHSQGILSPILGHVWTFLNNNLLSVQDCLFVLLCGITTYLILRNYLRKNAKASRVFLSAGLGSILFFTISLSTSVALLAYGYGPHTAVLGRALLLPIFSFYCGCVALIVSGMNFSESWISRTHHHKLLPAKLALSVVIVASSLYALPLYLTRIVDHVQTVVNYGTMWHAEDQTIRNQAALDPNAHIVVPDSFSGIGDGFNLRCDSPYSTWLNVGMDAYYKIGGICSDKNGP